MGLRGLDLFAGEGGSGMGYHRAGIEMFGVDNAPARLARYPFEKHLGDALAFASAHAHEFDFVHASPPCTGYSRGTAAIPDRLERYDRLIAVTREVLEDADVPYIIENVEDARKELWDPIRLCGFNFGLEATDTDGTRLYLKRHRLFETNIAGLRDAGDCPGHPRDGKQIAGVYGGARRDKVEARTVRKGGYVPADISVLQELLQIDWMTEKGMQLSIPPVYTEYLGRQLVTIL